MGLRWWVGNGEEDLSQYDFANLEPYVHPPETKEDLPWAELVTLDLEDYNRPGGKERLSKQLEHAVHHVGFVSPSTPAIKKGNNTDGNPTSST